MHAWEMTASFHGYLIGGALVKDADEGGKYEIQTPYQDMKGRIILYASKTEDGRIRISDGGYLRDNFLNQQVENSPFVVDMGVAETGEQGECKLENGELVLYATIDNFGASVCTLAHGIMLIGTSKNTMLMMIQVFKSVLSGPPQPIPFDTNEGGWPGASGGGFEA